MIPPVSFNYEAVAERALCRQVFGGPQNRNRFRFARHPVPPRYRQILPTEMAALLTLGSVRGSFLFSHQAPRRVKMRQHESVGERPLTGPSQARAADHAPGRGLPGWRTVSLFHPAFAARICNTWMAGTAQPPRWLSSCERAGSAAPGTGSRGRCAYRNTERPRTNRGTGAWCRIFPPAAAPSRSFRSRRFRPG